VFTITLSVPNISCQHCARAILKELSPLAGVSSVEVDVAEKRVTVSYDSESVLTTIESTLAEIGYPVAR